MLIDVNLAGRFSKDDSGFLFQSFKLSYARSVSFDDRARLKLLDKQFGDFSLQAIAALRKRLHHQYIVVAVDNQRRQQVAFGINQAVAIRFTRNRTASLRAIF
jgi:hypothetical protein